VTCLSHPNIGEGAAETLLAGLERDVEGHMQFLEREVGALAAVMDTMSKAAPAVQARLTHVLRIALEWRGANERVVLRLLGKGLVGLLAVMLKSDVLATQEAAIRATAALLCRVCPSPSPSTAPVSQALRGQAAEVVADVLLHSVVQMASRVSLGPHFRHEGAAMSALLSIYERLSEHPTAHSVLAPAPDADMVSIQSTQSTQSIQNTHSTQSIQSIQSRTPKSHRSREQAAGLGLGHGLGLDSWQSSPFSQTVLLFALFTNKGADMDLHLDTLASILSFSYNVVASSLDCSIFCTVHTASFLECCARVVCCSQSQRLRDLSIDLLYLFGEQRALGQTLLRARLCLPFADALVDSVCNAHEKKEKKEKEKNGAGVGEEEGEGEREEGEVVFSLDLLALVAHQVFALKTVERPASAEDFEFGEIYEIFAAVVERDELWGAVVCCLKVPVRYGRTAFAARLVHVLACCKDLAVMRSLQAQVQKHGVLQVLLTALSEAEAEGGAQQTHKAEQADSAPSTEMLLLAVGSLLGGGPFFPWEVAGLQRVDGGVSVQSVHPAAVCAGLSVHSSHGKAVVAPHPYRETSAVRLGQLVASAQRSANVEYGDSTSELKAMAVEAVQARGKLSPAGAVLAREHSHRVEVLLRLGGLLRTVVGKEEGGLACVVAALRILQGLLHDAETDCAELCGEVQYYCFVTRIPEMTPVQSVVALDVLGRLTSRADFCIDEAVQTVTLLIASSDTLVQCKAIDALVLCSMNPHSLHSIERYRYIYNTYLH
jgi:hypothetical protein